MQDKKLFSILTVICFCTFLFIPIGIALMIFFTDWKKKLKIILSSVLGALYVFVVIFALTFKPVSGNGNGGLNMPFGSSSSYSSSASSYDYDFEGKGEASNGFSKDSASKKNSSRSSSKASEITKPSKEKSKEKTTSSAENSGQGKASKSRLFYSILFIVIMAAIILWQNLRKRKPVDYENPYVDTSKYKWPLDENTKLPLVHCSRLHLNNGEVLHYATDTVQQNNEGVFIVTNQRIVIMNMEGTKEFTLDMLEAAVSTTNSVMCITAGDQKHYIFLPENQMKYALAVLRWTVKSLYDEE